MPRLDKETRERIRQIDYKDLQEIVVKMAAKEKSVYDFIRINYLDKEGGEKELFAATKADLNYLFAKGYRGFSEELQLANMLSACIKRINEFTKISKNKELEADLLLYVLEVPFGYPTKMLGTCFTQYDVKIGNI